MKVILFNDVVYNTAISATTNNRTIFSFHSFENEKENFSLKLTGEVFSSFDFSRICTLLQKYSLETIKEKIVEENGMFPYIDVKIEIM